MPIAETTNEDRRKRRVRRRESRPESARQAATPSQWAAGIDRDVWVCLLALGSTVIASALLMGAAHPTVALAVGVPVLIALFVVRGTRPIPRLGWALGGFSVYCALQALPLPIGAVRILSPVAARIWERGRVGETVRWAPLSIDPVASCLEVYKWCVYAAVVVLAVWLSRRRGTTPALAIVFASSLLVVLAWAGHAFLEAKTLYGVYHPRFVGGESLAPLLNRNNLGGYLLLGSFAGVGLMFGADLQRFKWPLAIGVSVLLTGLILTRSTGAVAAAGFGTLLLAALGWSRWRRAPQRIAMMGAVLGAAGVVAALVMPPKDWMDIARFSKKLILADWGVPLVRDFFWFGTGRGGFETVFPAYRQGTLAQLPNRVVFTHPENIVVQWAAEWGAPVALLGVVFIGWLFLRSFRARRATLGDLSVVAGLCALAAQNLVDLGLELPASGLAFSVCLGTLVGQGELRDGDQQHSPLPFRALTAGLAIVSAVTLMLLGPSLAWQDRDRVYDALLDVGRERRAENEAFFAEIGEKIRHRPAEPYFPLVAALATQRLGQNAMPWIARAIERDPSRGETYRVLALELARNGARIQALEALRHSIEWDPSEFTASVRLAREISQDARELVRAAPAGEKGMQLLLQVAPADNLNLRWDLVEIAMARDPNSFLGLSSYGDLIVDVLKVGHSRCLGELANGCAERLRATIAAMKRLDPGAWLSLRFEAELMRYEGNTPDALKMLARECAKVRDRARCFRVAMILAAGVGDRELLKAAVEDELRAACVQPSDCARAELEAGDVLMKAGAPALATEQYYRAAQSEPSRERWEKVARAARASGQETRARAAQRKAERLAGGSAATYTGP